MSSTRWLVMILFMLPATESSGQLVTPAMEDSVNVWYGYDQSFGNTGTVQRSVNILGDVSSLAVEALLFTLNDGVARSLAIGPDRRRLARKGDFNAEIPVDELRRGPNRVRIEALDSSGISHAAEVIVHWDPSPAEVSTSIDWGEVSRLNEVAQPIDGLWHIDEGQLISAPGAVGYDRAIGFGDRRWRDYEVLFPFMVVDLDTTSFQSEESRAPALMALIRWQGHTDAPVLCLQPSCGWDTFGAMMEFAFGRDSLGVGQLRTAWPDAKRVGLNMSIEVDRTYWVRIAADSGPAGNLYSVKVWPDDLGKEPEAWSAQKIAGPVNLSRGSFLLVAHHLDLRVGNLDFVQEPDMRNTIATLLMRFPEWIVEVPIIAVWVAGIFWALVFSGRDPARGRWLVLSFSVLLSTAIVGSALLHVVPSYVQESGWIMRRVTYVYVVVHAVPIVGHVVGFGIIFKVLLPTTSRNTGQS